MEKSYVLELTLQGFNDRDYRGIRIKNKEAMADLLNTYLKNI